MELLENDGPQWVVQPLIDVGLDLAEIGDLVVRLAFEGIVGEERGLAGLPDLVADRPPEIRAAWIQTISRLLALEP